MGFINRCRGGIVAQVLAFGLEICTRLISSQINQNDYLAEIIPPHHRLDERVFMQACR
jgi:hypothetical protein